MAENQSKMCESCSSMSIKLNDGRILTPGCIFTLGRFESEQWRLALGWYSYYGNRSTYGFYLKSESDNRIKPLYDSDLTDIKMISYGGAFE